jgi:hypothetical protein
LIYMTRTQLDRQDVILLLAAGADGPYDLDPIRLMKGCFVVSQVGRPEWREIWDFEPYDYGPFDTSVYRARDALLSRGLLQSDRNGRYSAYSLTDEGEARAAELAERLGTKYTEWLHRVGRYVTSKSFSSLLDEIYDRFPEYASRSVMRRA